MSADRLTAYELEAMRKRVVAATRYPWWYDPHRALVNSEHYVIARAGAGFETTPQDAANAAFIANARYDVAALLATVAALQAERAALQAERAALLEVYQAAKHIVYEEMPAGLGAAVAHARGVLDK
jgi:succinylglutamate desuccinylase